MQGNVKVSYKVLCDNEKDQELSLSDLIANVNVKKAIKSAFTNGRKNITISFSDDVKVLIAPEREVHELVISKQDALMDMLTLCEDDARKKKNVKKGCERVEIVDFETLKK
jgi:hypothetical protein